MTLAELNNDEQFKEHWPHVWSKLNPFFIQKMMDYAEKHAGEHEKIGQFAEFMAEIRKDYETLNSSLEFKRHQRPKLNNSVLNERPVRTPAVTQHKVGNS